MFRVREGFGATVFVIRCASKVGGSSSRSSERCLYVGPPSLRFRLRRVTASRAGATAPKAFGAGGGRRIRTFVGVSQQIYSLPSLAT